MSVSRAATPAEILAMRKALALATSLGVPMAPNPRVGAVLLNPSGVEIGSGFHRGAGTAHAEVAALESAARAGHDVAGATAVVTLEPCAHVGRTGSCATALIEAGVARVVYAQKDPNPLAAGGAARLRAAGVEVLGAVLRGEASAINEAWTFAITHQRPMVTWKVAATLDGRIAARDGSSRWVSGSAARAEVHQLRGQVQAVLIGTGTALADNPSLTARDEVGHVVGTQPTRVVMGRRPIPEDAALRDGAAALLTYPTQSPAEVLADLLTRGVQHVLLEGGPTLATSMLAAGLIDRVRWYVCPALLGAGQSAIGEIGVTSMSSIRRLQIAGITRVGGDVRVDATIGA